MSYRDEISSLNEKIRHLELSVLKQQEELNWRVSNGPTARPVGQPAIGLNGQKKGSAGSVDSNDSSSSSTEQQQAGGKERTTSLSDEIFVNSRELIPPHMLRALAMNRPQHSLDSATLHQDMRSRGRKANVLTLPIPPNNSAMTSPHHSRSPSPRPPLTPHQLSGRRIVRQKTLDRTHSASPHPPSYHLQPLNHNNNNNNQAKQASSWNDVSCARQQPPTPLILTTNPTINNDSGTESVNHSPGLDKGGASSAGSSTGSLWASPTLRRVIAPLQQSLSMSAENLPNKAKSPLSRVPWANIRLAQMSKCQSVD